MRLLPDELDWLAQGLLAALVAGLLLAAVVGLVLLVRPGALFRLNDRLSRPVAVRGLDWLQASITVERWCYRHHRLFGSLLASAAAWVLWRWSAIHGDAALRAFSRPELDWIVAALEGLLVGLHAVILLLGLVIMLRPSLLRRTESAANRWYELPGAAALDAVVARPDARVRQRPRLTGLLLVLAAGGCLVALAPVLAFAAAG